MEFIQLALNSTATLVGRSSVAATEFIIKVNYEIYGLGQQREADFYERREGEIFWASFCPALVAAVRPRTRPSLRKEEMVV